MRNQPIPESRAKPHGAWSAHTLLAAAYAGDRTAFLPIIQLLRWKRAQVAEALGISPHTVEAYKEQQRNIPLAKLRLLAILAGYVPWPGWQGWEVHRGCLFPPGQNKHGLLPGDIQSQPILYQLTQAQQQERAALDRQLELALALDLPAVRSRRESLQEALQASLGVAPTPALPSPPATPPAASQTPPAASQTPPAASGGVASPPFKTSRRLWRPRDASGRFLPLGVLGPRNDSRSNCGGAGLRTATASAGERGKGEGPNVHK